MKRWLLVGLYFLSIIWFSAQPQSSAGSMSLWVLRYFPELTVEQASTLIVFIRKFGHVIAYFWATVVILFAVRATPFLKRHPLVSSGAIALMLASIDEYYQAQLVHRTGTVRDVLVDAIGIVLALSLAYLWGKRRDFASGAEESRQRRDANDENQQRSTSDDFGNRCSDPADQEGRLPD